MLTRLEIGGFKTFDSFAIDVPPFLGVIGPNASGKSNLFDAIQFLRRLTEFNLTVALRDARGELDDLFRRRGDGSTVQSMYVNIEVLLNPRVRDSWGTEVELTQTRMRYELTLVHRTDDEGNVRLFVEQERAEPIRKSHDRWIKRFNPSAEFIEAYVRDGRRTSPFLETVTEGRRRSFKTRQDGVAGRARPAEAAEATVLSSMNSAEFKHLYALREEILSWRFLQLDPMSLRLPGEKFGEERLEPTGGNLARVLHRIQVETASEDRPLGSLSDISSDMGSLIEGVRSVSVVENDQTKKWEILLRSIDEGTYSSSVASDGTLRVLALLAALYDPTYRGLICFEEPENGVHPLRLRTLVAYLRELVADLHDVQPDPAVGLAQMLVNSHSPVVLSAVADDEAVVLDSATLVERTESGPVRSRVSRVRRVYRKEQMDLPLEEIRDLVDRSEIERFTAAALLDERATADDGILN